MKKIINSKNAPAPIGPYNQAIMVNDLLFTSGQIAIDPQTKELIVNNISDEVRQVMHNLKAVLKASNLDFENVIKSTIYLTNMDDFAKINEVYGSFFKSHSAPARETIQVAKLPKNVHLEISVIAAKLK